MPGRIWVYGTVHHVIHTWGKQKNSFKVLCWFFFFFKRKEKVRVLQQKNWRPEVNCLLYEAALESLQHDKTKGLLTTVGGGSILEEAGNFCCLRSLSTLKHSLYFSHVILQFSHVLAMSSPTSKFTLQIRENNCSFNRECFQMCIYFQWTVCSSLFSLLSQVTGHTSPTTSPFILGHCLQMNIFPCHSHLHGSLERLPVCNVFYWLFYNTNTEIPFVSFFFFLISWTTN